MLAPIALGVLILLSVPMGVLLVAGSESVWDGIAIVAILLAAATLFGTIASRHVERSQRRTRRRG